MPTDIQKLRKLFMEFDVGFSERITKTRNPNFMVIECMCGNNKIAGYNGFFTEFVFDLDGKFIEMGAGE